jgi:hypothetical protein
MVHAAQTCIDDLDRIFAKDAQKIAAVAGDDLRPHGKVILSCGTGVHDRGQTPRFKKAIVGAEDVLMTRR